MGKVLTRLLSAARVVGANDALISWYSRLAVLLASMELTLMLKWYLAKELSVWLFRSPNRALSRASTSLSQRCWSTALAGQWCWSTALAQTDEKSTRVVGSLGQVSSLTASLHVVAALSMSMRGSRHLDRSR